MAQRPRLTDESFLAHLFHPKKNAVPTGLRKTHLSSSTGRSKARLRSYNRMSAVNQETLKRTGQRDAYLKGETTLGKAKASLRDAAIRVGVAKPVRIRTTPRGTVTRPGLANMLAQHIKNVMIDAGRPVNTVAVDIGSDYYDEAGVPVADAIKWDYGQLKYAGRKGSEYEISVNGQTRNPLWYH
jgi:hypothetical protein